MKDHPSEPGRISTGGASKKWKQLIALFQPYRRQFAFLILLSVLTSVLTSSNQLTMTPLIGLILQGGQVALPSDQAPPAFTLDLDGISNYILYMIADLTGVSTVWGLLVVVSAAYLAVALVAQAVSFFLRYRSAKMEYGITRDIGSKVYDHLLHLPLTILSSRHIGWFQSRIINDVRAGMLSVNELIVDGLSSALLSLFYVVLLISTDIRLTIAAAAAGIVHIALSQILSKQITRYISGQNEAIANASGQIQERLAAIREVKSLAAEDYERREIYRLLTEYAEKGFLHHIFKRLEAPIRWSINRTVIIAVMLFGSWLLLNNQITLIGFGLFMYFAQSLIGPLSSLAGIMIHAASIESYFDEILNILQQSPEPTGARPVACDQFQECIEFCDISFAYTELPVLTNINLAIRKGEMVALVGHSGSGKSTLVDLLLRFYQPDAGQILMDGIPIEEFDLRAYRRLFGLVSQHSVLLNDTVYYNIAYARPEITQEEVERAARMANAHDFIMQSLSDGYQTVLGERGVRLSGGQRQRIAIARAIAHQPSVLVLDEATSALDSESERLVQNAIDQLARGSTTMVVAHRLSTVQRADKIVVLKEGAIVEVGAHDELMALNGEYRLLYDQQFAQEPLRAAHSRALGITHSVDKPKN